MTGVNVDSPGDSEVGSIRVGPVGKTVYKSVPYLSRTSPFIAVGFRVWTAQGSAESRRHPMTSSPGTTTGAFVASFPNAGTSVTSPASPGTIYVYCPYPS